MNRSIARLWCLGLLGLVWFAAAAQAQFQGPPIHAWKFKVKFDVDFQTLPDPNRPTAPWYTYFPADPRLLPSPQLTPYPPWPGQFPPTSPSTDPRTMAPRQAYPPPGPRVTQYQPSPSASGSTFVPAGYVPAQTPSYWYQGR